MLKRVRFFSISIFSLLTTLGVTILIINSNFTGPSSGEDLLVNIDTGTRSINPKISIISPVEQEMIHGSFIIEVEVLGFSNISKVEISIDEELNLMEFNNLTKQFEFVIKPEDFKDGEYIIFAIATNTTDGSISTRDITCHIDNTPPEISFRNSMQNLVLSGLYRHSVEIIDDYPSVTEYRIDDGRWNGIYSPWDTTDYIDGDHIYSVRSTDQAGHASQKNISLIVDNTDPSIDQLSIFPGSVFQGEAILQFRVYDEIGLKKVNAHMDDTANITLVEGLSDNIYEYLMNTELFPDGRHIITIYTTDKAENMVTATYGFKIDNSGPLIRTSHEWYKPGSSRSYSDIWKVHPGSSVKIQADVWDVSSTESVSISFDGSNWINMSLKGGIEWISYTYSFIIEDNDKPFFYYQIKATDEHGQSSIIQSEIQIDTNYSSNENEDVGSDKVTNWILISLGFVVFIIIATASVIIIFLRRRRKESCYQIELDESS